jgi:phytoene dehydrogenase-like protein
MAQARAVVIGAGISGLAAAAGLCSGAGLSLYVTACRRLSRSGSRSGWRLTGCGHWT